MAKTRVSSATARSAYPPWTIRMSGKLQPMALTSINTWPGPGIGSGTSAYCISDGSPHCVAIMAFMSIDHTMRAMADGGAVPRRTLRGLHVADGGVEPEIV